MKGVGLQGSCAFVACAVLAVVLAGCAAQRTRAASPPGPATSTARSAGGSVFDRWCGDCHHTPDGPGSLALQRKYRGAVPAVLEQRTNLPPAYVKLVVRRGISFMPSFRKTEISDADLQLVATYLTPSP